MQADWDDAPEHLRTKKPSPGRPVTVTSIGPLALMGFGIVIDVIKLIDALQVHIAGTPPPTQPQPALADKPAQAEVQAPNPHQSYQATHTVAAQERNAQGKQVVFNDHNHIPKTAVSTYKAPKKASIFENPPPQRQQTQRFIRSAGWHWDNGYEEKKIQEYFEWVAASVNSDLSSICRNLKRGSLIFSDGQKVAKVALNKMRENYGPACYAGRNL